MRPGRRRRARPRPGSNASTWGARAGWPTGSTPCTCRYVREKTGHALIGARQWIPREQIEDPVRSLVMGLPPDLGFRTKGQLAIDICTDALRRRHAASTSSAGTRSMAAAPQLRAFFEDHGQAYVLRVASNFMLTLAAGTKLTCAEAVDAAAEGPAPLGGPLRREGLQGRALVRLGLDRHRLPAAPPAHPPPPGHRRAGLPLLLRARGPDADQDPADPRRRAAMAGGREISSSARTASAWTSPRSGSTPRSPGTPCWSWPPWPSAPSPPPCCATAPTPRPRRPSRPDQPPPADPGMIPLTVPEIKRLLAAACRAASRPATPPTGSHWRRRHQARSRWYHQRARLNREHTLVS